MPAMEVGRGEFAPLSGLGAEGSEPFAAGSPGKAIFGMKKGNDFCLCFPTASQNRPAERREMRLACTQGRSARSSATRPTFPVARGLVQREPAGPAARTDRAGAQAGDQKE